MIQSDPIDLPCSVHALEAEIRAFCQHNACYDTACVGVCHHPDSSSPRISLRIFSLKPELPHRAATEEDIDNGLAKWCSVCIAPCPLSGKDCLVVCDEYKERATKEPMP